MSYQEEEKLDRAYFWTLHHRKFDIFLIFWLIVTILIYLKGLIIYRVSFNTQHPAYVASYEPWLIQKFNVTLASL